MTTKNYFLLCCLIILFAFLSFYHAFNFAFIVDDWDQLWGVFYDRSIIYHYITTQHPNSAYEFLITAPLFKFNPFYYQLVGYFLKIINSMFVALLIYVITKSKIASIFSSLIFASSVMGLETFTRISAHNSALLIPTLCLGLYFWIHEDKDKALIRYTIAILFFIVSIIQDPGVGVMVLPAAFGWKFLNLIKNFNKENLSRFFITTPILILIPILLKWYLDPRFKDRNLYLTKHLYYSLSHITTVITNFSTSIGNLISGWLIPFEESIGLTNPNPLTTLFGYITIILTIVIGLVFFLKKTKPLMIIFFLSIWIFLFYFPDWFTQTHYVEGGVISAVSNRYFAISSIGIIGLIAYLLSLIRFKTAIIILILIIISNILNANRILKNEYTYRSLEVQNKLYNKIDQDLPRDDEKNKILVFLGNNTVKVFGLDWNGFYPIAVRRGITQKQEFSQIINNLAEIKQLICTDKSSSLESKFSRLYAWAVQDGEIYNVSDEIRLQISNECRVKS